MSEPEEELVEQRLKIVLLGDCGAGKTSIAIRYCNEEFTRHYVPTAGIDFFLKSISLGVYRNVTLHIWDVSGLALRGSMLDKYIFDAQVIFFVYDVTNASSFDILQEWMDVVKQLNIANGTHPIMAILGNKCDVEHQRTVKRDRSHAFAARNGIPCHDVSARTGESVKDNSSFRGGLSVNITLIGDIETTYQSTRDVRQISIRIASFAAQLLGVQSEDDDRESYKPIVQEKLNDKSATLVTNQKSVKKQVASNLIETTKFQPASKSSICVLQ